MEVRQMNNKLFSDDSGNPSITRVVWAIGVLVILGTWSYECITGDWVTLSVGDATALGMILGLKVGQKAIEGRE